MSELTTVSMYNRGDKDFPKGWGSVKTSKYEVLTDKEEWDPFFTSFFSTISKDVEFVYKGLTTLLSTISKDVEFAYEDLTSFLSDTSKNVDFVYEKLSSYLTPLLSTISEIALEILLFPFTVFSYIDVEPPYYDKKSEKFIEFYHNYNHLEPNSDGFRLRDILKLSDADIQAHIEWLFPIEETVLDSSKVPTATPTVIEAFKANKHLKKNLLRSFETMLSFYGLQLVNEKIEKGPNFDEKRKNWLLNNGSIQSRMIKSLATLGREDLAIKFFEALEKVCLESQSDIFKKRLERTCVQNWLSSITECIPTYRLLKDRN